jgi:chromate transporter
MRDSIAVPRVALATVLAAWGRIGLLGFGGPPAHVALLRAEAVGRRDWISPQEFEDATAACSLLPGPASTQMAIYCAWRVRGAAGALVGGLAFIVPGLVVVLLLAAAALERRPPEWIRGLGAGGAAAVVAVIAQAGLALARTSVRGPRGAAYLAVGAVAAVLAGPGVVVALVACGALEVTWRRRGAAHAVAWPLALAWTSLKVGGLAFGGGYVIVPLMHGDAVAAHGWMTDAQFASAVAFGALTPGPVTHTVALVGWAAGGLPGALLAAAVAFAPSFAFVLLGGRRFARLRASPAARGFLDGAGPAAVGAILGAAVPLGRSLTEPWQWAVLAAAALALAAGRSPAWPLIGGAACGLAAAGAGLGLP